MAPPQLTDDEIDDINFAARAGETDELDAMLAALAQREAAAEAEVLVAARDDSKATALHKAAGNGHLDTVNSILRRFVDRPAGEKQAFVDAANEFGNTGLHWAALGGHLAVVRCLVEEHGAGVGLANDRNYVPLDLASFGDEPKRDVVDYFLSTMDKLEQEQENEGGAGLAAAAEGLAVGGGDDGGDEEVVSMSAKAGDGDVKA